MTTEKNAFQDEKIKKILFCIAAGTVEKNVTGRKLQGVLYLSLQLAGLPGLFILPITYLLSQSRAAVNANILKTPCCKTAGNLNARNNFFIVFAR